MPPSTDSPHPDRYRFDPYCSSLPTYQTQHYTSFHPSIPHSFLTPINTTTDTSFQIPLTDIPPAQHAQTDLPLVYPALQSRIPSLSLPSNEQVFASLASMTPPVSPSLVPYINLPTPTNSFTLPVPSHTPPEAPPPQAPPPQAPPPEAPTNTTTVPANTRTRRKKKPSTSTKRSRTKASQPTPARALPPTNISPVPQRETTIPPSQKPQISSMPERMPSRVTPPHHNNIPFTVPKPYQESPSLNFANVALEASNYRNDRTRFRYGPRKESLEPRERVTQGSDHANLLRVAQQVSAQQVSVGGEPASGPTTAHATATATTTTGGVNCMPTQNFAETGFGGCQGDGRGTSGTVESWSGYQGTSDNSFEENAAECLMTLAKSERGGGSHLNGGAQMENNFGNCGNGSTIPGRVPPSLAETAQPAAAMASLGIPSQCTQSTPVDIRDTDHLFARLPTASSHHVSRNRSLTQHIPLFVREHRTPVSPASHIVHPLFQETQTFALPQHTMHQLHPLPSSPNLPTLYNQFPVPITVPTQPPLPREPPKTPATTTKQATMPNTEKRPKKKRTPRDPSALPKKTTKATAKRAANKTPKPKQPRKSRKPPVPCPSILPAPVANTANSIPANPTPPHLQIPHTNTPTLPSLRFRANLATTAPAVPPTPASLPSSTKHLHQQPIQRPNVSPLHNLLPSRPQAHTFPVENPKSKPSQAQRTKKGAARAKRTKPSNSTPRNVPAEKTRPTIEKALKAAAKAAARDKQIALSLLKPHVMGTPLPQQVLHLRPPLPPQPLQTVPMPNGAAQVDCASSAQKRTSQETGDMGAPANESTPTPTHPATDPVSAKRPSGKDRSIGTVQTNHLHVRTEPTAEGQDASSPRTESTQQTLLPDTSSVGPSDVEIPSEADDDIPLAQTKKRPPGASGATGRDPDSAVEAGVIENQRQSGIPRVPLQQSSTVPTGTRTDAALDCATSLGTQVAATENPLLSSRKRQNSSKSTDGNKRRKKNPANNPEPNSSASKKKSQVDKGVARVSEEAMLDASIPNQQDTVPAPKMTTSLKKSGVRGQTKNKTARQSTPARKRPSSGTKTQTKEKSKRNSPPHPNWTATLPRTNGPSNLRLCLTVREKDARSAPATGTKPSGDSCGSPVTPERYSNVFKYTPKSPPKTGCTERKKSIETGTNCTGKKSEPTPCFREELRNLQTSGILKAGEGISTKSSSENLLCSVPNVQRVVCVLCQKRGSHNEMVKHPCFPVRAFDICKQCSEIVSKRVEDFGVKRKDAVVSSKESITQRTTLFVMLIEEMVTHFLPSDREHRDVARIYDFISNRKFTEMAERAKSLSVHLDMLTVLRVTLRKIGFTVRSGKLRWPIGDFTLPAFADARALVAHALPARIDDFRKGILPGEAAWNETFGENEKLSMQSSSCAIYKKVFGLIGLKLVHVTECDASDSSAGTCKVKFEAVSIGVLMYRTAAMLSGTVTRELLAACWTRDEAYRFIDETEIELHSEPFDGAPKSCCICGGSEKPRKEPWSFRYSNCIECLKSFCSVCLLNVLGTTEYLRSFGDDGYCCMMCRLQKNAELCPSGKPNRGDQDRRLRLHNIGGIKKRTERRIKSMPPLLLLSASARADILLGSESSEARKALGFAKFCEVANDNSVRSAMDAECFQASHDICLGCKVPANGEEQDVSEGGVLSCGNEGCINVMHKTCLAPQPQARRRGSRSKWSCPHHQCSKCEQRDESKLLRCRTCPRTYCKEHMPSPSEVYLFSEKSFACSECRPFLRVPQMLRLKPQGSKSERKRSHISQALVIDQLKRSAAVKKLSEASGSGCNEVASCSFNEFRRELKMK